MSFLAIERVGQVLEQGRHCDSRSLLLDRFSDPRAEKDERRRVFERALQKRGIRTKLGAWALFVNQTGARLITARLESRMMVNMTGGVMENAGLCLDRFGMPYIPGSAVKGCARRAAIAALREWCETGRKPSDDHPLARCCEGFQSPADLLETMALVFGWTEIEWDDGKNKEGQYKSDLVWAADTDGNRQNLSRIMQEVVGRLLKRRGEQLNNDEDWKKTSERLANSGGTVAFLPAYPLPKDQAGKLELDVVTCHHREYYEGRKPVATDDEEPNPVVFPAVAPGHVFLFALVPLQNAEPRWLDHAQRWLETGLEVFGLGAKVNAGYGSFRIPREGGGSQAPAAGAGPASDYTETTFNNGVMVPLRNLGQIDRLREQIARLQQPQNQRWLQEVQQFLCSRNGREAAQRLRTKDWFPKEWLPPQTTPQ